MKQTLIIFVIISTVLLQFSCAEEKTKNQSENEKKTKPDFRKLENQKMDSLLSANEELKNYVAAKAVIRSFGDESENRPDFLNEKTYEIAQKYLNLIIKGEEIESTDLLMDLPAILILKAKMEKIPESFYALNENDYPPLLQTVSKSTQLDLPKENWNATYEHFILAVTAYYSGMSDKIMFYELTQAKTENIDQENIKLILSLFKALSYIHQDFPYHAEEELQLSKSYTNGIEHADQFLALIDLTQGLALLNMPDPEDNAKATEYFNNFIEATKDQTGISEWKFLSELAFMIIENKNTESYIKQNLKGITDDGLKLILKNQSAENTENVELIRNLVMTGVAIKILYNKLEESDLMADLTKSELGNGLLDFYKNIELMKGLVKDIESLGTMF